MDLGSPLLLGSSDRWLRRRAATDIPFKTLCFLNLSTIEGWETPHTTTDDNAFFSECEPRRVYWDISLDETFDCIEARQVSFASSPSSTLPTPPRQKRNLSMGCLFLKKGECRSTPATHAASPYQPKRHPIAQGETQTLMLVIRLLTNYS